MGAERALDELVAEQITGPVTSRPFDGGALISVGSRVVLALTTADIDNLSGETIQGVSAQTVARLRQALAEAAEARTPRALLRAAAMAFAVLVVGLAALWVISRVQRVAAATAGRRRRDRPSPGRRSPTSSCCTGCTSSTSSADS